MKSKNKKSLPKNNGKQDNDRFKDVPLNFENIIRTAINYDPKKSEKEKIKPFMLLITEENYEQVLSIIDKENLEKLVELMKFQWNSDLFKTLKYVNGKFIKFQTDMDTKELFDCHSDFFCGKVSHTSITIPATIYYDDTDYHKSPLL